MNPTVVAAAAFAILLGLERRYQVAPVRIGVALLAMVVLLFAQPNYTRASRQAVVTPPAKRVTQIRGRPLPEYASGVFTMEEAVAADAEMGAGPRRIATGVLIWLACAPAFPRRRARDAAAAGGSAATEATGIET